MNVTKLIREKHKNTDLWYTTYPKRLLSLAQLPEHMAKDPKFKDKRKTPNIKIFIGPSVISKIHSVYSMWWYEYFYQVKVGTGIVYRKGHF